MESICSFSQTHVYYLCICNTCNTCVLQICYTIHTYIYIYCNPMGCSLPGSSVHGIFQAIVLEWIAISFSRGSSQARDRTRVSHTVDRRLTVWATREVQRNFRAFKKSFSTLNGKYLFLFPDPCLLFVLLQYMKYMCFAQLLHYTYIYIFNVYICVIFI